MRKNIPIILSAASFTLLLIIAGIVGQSTPDSNDTSAPDERAGWGIKQLYPTRSGGEVWYSDWEHSLSHDHWIETTRTGANFRVDTEAETLEVGGATVRMYVRHPGQRAQWTGGLEVTVYGKRLDGSNRAVPYSGIVTSVRTNHGTEGNVDVDPCDSRGLYARLRFDGYADFGKEVRHPNTVARDEKRVFPGGMPTGVWIGYKHVVYDTETGVVQELWVDRPGGGEDWQRVNRIVDTGKRWGKGERPCHKGVNPAMELRGGTQRKGSESGLPNLAVLFRADDLAPSGGLVYQHASIREISH